MKKFKLLKYFIFLTAAVSCLCVVSITLVSCQKENLKALVQQEQPLVIDVPLAKVRGDFCTTESSKISTNLKFLFVIDKSGSNQDNITSPGTDPDGSRRYLPLLSFLQKRKSQENMYFALLNFSTDPSRIPTDGKTMFTNNADTFLKIVEKERNPSNAATGHPTDEGWTNYTDTFREVQKIIYEDLELEKAKKNPLTSNYVIFLVSDGAPITSQDDKGVYVMQKKEDVLATVSGVMALQKINKDLIDSITIHAAHYFGGVIDNDATLYMQAIAQLAQGTFQEFSGTSQVNFEDYSVPQRNAKNNLTSVFVENKNVVWEGGKLMADSDGDGLSDELERSIGSDPLKADSDGNGISDAVEYYTFGKPCKDSFCKPERALLKSECATWKRPSTGGQNRIEFYDTDGDGLNDCEEFILGTDRRKFDSNDDGIPDGLGFKNRIAIVAGTNEAGLDPDFDGISNMNEIKFGTPPRYQNSAIIGLNPMQYRLDKISETDEKSCYHLEVDDLKTLPVSGKKGNTIKILISESNASISGREILRTAEKEVDVNVDPIILISNSDFK